jgi:hypothetical protein
MKLSTMGRLRRLASTSRFALAACIALGSGACTGSATSPREPAEALRAYAHALDEKRIEDAYHMLSEEARRGLSLEAFRRAVLENPSEAKEIARALSRPSGDARVTARVILPTGEELPLVLEDGAWKVEGSAIDLYGSATPRQALLGFIRAFERKRWDVVLRYVPEEERVGAGPARGGPPPPEAAPAAQPPGSPPKADGAATPPRAPDADGGALTAAKLKQAWEGPQRDEMIKIVEALRAALPTASIEETGDSASMPYGAGGTVSFVREKGAWKIQDF